MADIQYICSSTDHSSNRPTTCQCMLFRKKAPAVLPASVCGRAAQQDSLWQVRARDRKQRCQSRNDDPDLEYCECVGCGSLMITDSSKPEDSICLYVIVCLNVEHIAITSFDRSAGGFKPTET